MVFQTDHSPYLSSNIKLMIKKGHLTIKENTEIQPAHNSRLNSPNHPFRRGVNKQAVIDNNILSNMDNRSLAKNEKTVSTTRRIAVKYGFNKLTYMLSVAPPEIIGLLEREDIINPVYVIRNYLYNLPKIFRGRIQVDLGWRTCIWDDKISRLVKNETTHRLLTKAEVNQIYNVLQLMIADFDDVCVQLGFTNEITPSECEIFNGNSEMEYESLYGKFSKSCRPNLLRVYYDYIKFAQAHFSTHFLTSIGKADGLYYRTSKIPRLFVNGSSIFIVPEIEKMRLSFLYVKSHLQFLINKRSSLDELRDE